MNPLQVNPTTGFLESKNPTTLECFDSDKKLKFLELATECARKREFPDLASLCDCVGIKSRTLYQHFEIDSKFKEAWNEIKARLMGGFTNELSIKAKGKGGIIANLAVLKYLESGSWMNDTRVMINTNNASVKSIVNEASDVIDGEIVNNQALPAPHETDQRSKDP